MKKFLALLMALLLMGSVSLASDITESSTNRQADTTVTFTIENNESYIVTIPPTVELAAADGSAAGAMTIQVSAPRFNNPAKAIAVQLARSLHAFRLVCGNESLPYAITLDGQTVAAGDQVLLWTYSPDRTDVSARLDVNATYSVNQTAGQYTDTLTFTVSVIDQP